LKKRKISYKQAIYEALREALIEDKKVVLIGEDIGVYGGAFGVTKGLLEEFGDERIIDTPISEASIVGLALGASLVGIKPVVEIMFMDFITLCIDQILNHITKLKYIYGGKDEVTVPLVIRTPAGAGRRYGASHSQNLEKLFMGMPGLKIVAPSTPFTAKGLLKAAIADPNPVLFIEGKLLYSKTGEVPEGKYFIPIKEGRIVQEGQDLTILSYLHTVALAIEAASILEKDGIKVEVIDLQTLSPLPWELIKASLHKTKKIIVVEEGTLTCGIGAEICARLTSECFWDLDAPPQRVATEDLPIPYSPPLEDAAVPSLEKILLAVEKIF